MLAHMQRATVSEAGAAGDTPVTSTRIKRPTSIAAAHLASGLVIIIAFLIRWRLARVAQYPGHADAAYYYGLAEALAAGRGFTIDYIWHFLVSHESLTHYATDYWVPGTSLVLLLPELLGAEISVANGLRVFAVLGVALSVVTYLLAIRLRTRGWVPPAAAATMAVIPGVAMLSGTLESAFPFALLTTASFALLADRSTRLPMTILGGVTVGMSHWVRNEGILILVSALTVFAIQRRPPRNALAFVGAYAATMTPLAILNWQGLGRLWPSSLSHAPWITRYEDLYSIPNQNPAAPGALIDGDRWSTVPDSFLYSFTTLGTWLTLGAGCIAAWSLVQGIRTGSRYVEARRIRSSPWLLPATTAVSLYALHLLVTSGVSSGGGLQKSSLALAPAVVIGSSNLLSRLIRSRGDLALVPIGIFVVASMISLPGSFSREVETNNSIGTLQSNLAIELAAFTPCPLDDYVVMTRNPWEFNQATGLRTIQIPNESMGTILDVANRYGVTHIVPDPTRPQISDRAIWASRSDAYVVETSSGWFVRPVASDSECR
jgi:hypothetical protein